MLGWQVCGESRMWQLEQIKEGFRDGRTLLSDFLVLFSPGAARTRLICGQEVTTKQLLDIIEVSKY